ncbi:H-NS histone family protein [Acidovorax sp. LjRoot129]|uniref:H-NS histone family protein n=1 Tax=unclassified Acidovorax TaxID=2684926 RepID=UPI003ECDFBBC
MATYQELMKQKQELEAQIAEARKSEVGEAIATIKKLCADFSLTEKDIFGGKAATGESKSSRKGSTVAAKYRDPASGSTWTGRGKAPRWIAGASDRTQYLINS